MAQLIRKWFSMIFVTTLLAALPVIANAALAKANPLGWGNVYLELDGMSMGPLMSFEGGMPYAELVTMQMGANVEQQKRPGPVKYGEMTLSFGGSMGKPLYQWMQDLLANRSYPKSGAIVFTDQSNVEVKRLAFFNAQITEIGLPALDANDGKSIFKFTLKLIPEITRPELAKGGKLAVPFTQKSLVYANNFRLNMPGVDSQWATRIEPLVASVKFATDTGGKFRNQVKQFASVEFSGLVVTMPEGRGQSMGDWFNDFVVKGNNGPGREKSATIELLDPTLKTTLMAINLNTLWILKMEPVKFEDNKDVVRTIRASMNCGSMQFNLPGK